MYKDELFKAIHDRDYFLLRALIMLGARVDVTDDNGYTPIHIALLENAGINIIELLIAHGADVTAPDPEGLTPLHMAAEYAADMAVFAALIGAGGDINAMDNDDQTPLDLVTDIPLSDALEMHYGATASFRVIARGGACYVEFSEVTEVFTLYAYSNGPASLLQGLVESATE